MIQWLKCQKRQWSIKKLIASKTQSDFRDYLTRACKEREMPFYRLLVKLHVGYWIILLYWLIHYIKFNQCNAHSALNLSVLLHKDLGRSAYCFVWIFFTI